MYLDNRVLRWQVDIQSQNIIDKKIVARASELHDRAERHLNSDMSRDARADCLVTLKRALNQRLKAIEEIYQFKKISIPNKPNGYLEILEKFGLVRPILLKKLMTVRNDIEHEDIKPPSYNQCKEYVDVVWYFLKSTTQIVSFKTTSIIFNKIDAKGRETQYWISLEIKESGFDSVEISGWVPKSYIKSKADEGNLLELDIIDIGTKEERWAKGNLVSSKAIYHDDKKPSDTWIRGFLILTPEQKLIVIKKTLNV